MAQPGAPSDLLGAGATLTRTVRTTDTAEAVGSGDVPVLATPRLLAWLEATTVMALRGLAPDRTSVGTNVTLAHLRATPVEATVTCTARVVGADERTVTLAVEASEHVDGGRLVVARGEVVRAIVDRERFLARAGAGGG